MPMSGCTTDINKCWCNGVAERHFEHHIFALKSCHMINCATVFQVMFSGADYDKQITIIKMTKSTISCPSDVNTMDS